MALRQTSDSLSRCDPSLYSNIYDVRRHSDFKMEAVAKPNSKDTIEISRDKIKEEALQYLRRPAKYVIAQSSFMRIGKYLFLAIALPPYLLLYGLPKWILVEALPVLFSLSLWVWKKVQQPTKKGLGAGIQQVVQMMQFVQKMNRIMIQPVVRFVLEIRQWMQRFRQQVDQFFQQINEKVKWGMNWPFYRMPEKMRRAKEKIVQIRERIREQWTKQVDHLSSQIQSAIQWIKQSPQMMWNWGRIQFQRFTEKIASWKAPWNGPLQKSQQLAKRANDWIFRQMREVVQGIKHDLKPLHNFYCQQVLPHWQKFKQLCRASWKKGAGFFQGKHRRALAFVKAQQEKLKQLSHSTFLHHWLSKLQHRWLKKWLSHPMVQAFCRVGIRLYCHVAGFLLRLTQSFLEVLAKGFEFISKACQWLGASWRFCHQKFLTILEIGFNMGGRFSVLALYYVLLSLMMMMILFVWSMRSLGHFSNSLTKKFKSLR